MSSDTLLKTINVLPTTIHVFAARVQLVFGYWKGLTDFTVTLMDMFDIILGLNFWYEINAFILPHINQLHIKDLGGSCMVSFIQVPQNGMHLFAMQLVKDFKREEPTLLVALTRIVENPIEAVTLPSCIEKVLNDNKDVMPEELPKQLPP